MFITCINDATWVGLKCVLFEVSHYLGWGAPGDLRTRFGIGNRAFDKWDASIRELERDSLVAPRAIGPLRTLPMD